MPVQTMNYDTAKNIGYNTNIFEVNYRGPLNEYDDFCEYVRLKFPNLISFRVNVPVDHIPDKLMYRLQKIDCSNTLISKLRYGPVLNSLIATNTGIQLRDVTANVKKINYLKLGNVANGTRITIDSNEEYQEFLSI
jgi:hypothetical protein